MANQAYPRSLWRIDHTSTILELVTPEEFATLPDGTELVAIDGEHVVKGKSDIDDDTRGGYMAFGFVVKSS